jgi:predicted regulator of Ras-like GTPase activity (Roadblock/LC7/MglB family)
MEALPQLIEDDIESLAAVLDRLIFQSEADVALVTDRAGFLIVEKGDLAGLDQTTLAALAANAYAATAAMAGLINEADFASIYQEGARHSLMINSVGEYGLLIVVFSARISGGAVKYYASSAVREILEQMKVAHRRAPELSIDLAMMNVMDTSDVFRRKQ